LTRRDTPFDPVAILRALADQDVSYVVIGGVAVQAHGHTRTTQDLDVVPQPSADNLERLRQALHDLGVSVGDVVFPDMGTLTLNTAGGGLDVHMRPPGGAPYEQLRERALELVVGGVGFAVASRDDLIAMKRASERPIDRGDVITLSQPDKPT
jgi:predicted nucleotidyltransferase